MRAPWIAEGRLPTPEEWRDYFILCHRDQQLELVDHSQRSARCVTMGHDNLLYELEHQRQSMRTLVIQHGKDQATVIRLLNSSLTRYRLAWLSARRRARG